MDNNLATELKKASLKVTPSRIAILSLLKKHDTPIGVGTILKELLQTSTKPDYVTVFRTINIFTEKGLIRRIQFQEGNFRYELNTENHHHHIVCVKCGRVEDIDFDVDLAKHEREIAKQTGFKIKEHSIEFFGVCKKCKTKQS